MMPNSQHRAAPTYGFGQLSLVVRERLTAIWHAHDATLHGTGCTLPVLWCPAERHALPREIEVPMVFVLQVAGRHSPRAASAWCIARDEMLSACEEHGVAAVAPAPIWLSSTAVHDWPRRPDMDERVASGPDATDLDLADMRVPEKLRRFCGASIYSADPSRALSGKTTCKPPVDAAACSRRNAPRSVRDE